MHPLLAHSTPLPALPQLHVRPAVLALLAAWSALLLLLGFAPLGSRVPIDDKVLHFVGIGVFTALTYFLLHVPDASRRIWYYRRAPMLITLALGFVGAGVLSEIVQGLLPWKTFQYGDIIANLLGASTAYAASHALLIRHRRAATIARLYLPITQQTARSTSTPNADGDDDGRGRESVDSAGRGAGTWDVDDGWDVPREGPAAGKHVFEIGGDD